MTARSAPTGDARPVLLIPSRSERGYAGTTLAGTLSPPATSMTRFELVDGVEVRRDVGLTARHRPGVVPTMNALRRDPPT
ncbi:MAG TPA: hypothetical protein VFE19_07365 [Jatrophihabitantaceae bacterium]|nr:hypothetical protein [Jatrophihabitantaceae bacterium]